MATYQQITDPAQLFMELVIDHPAVTLSTAAGYQTLQLTATPRDALGEPMEGLPAPTFHLKFDTDSTKVRVTPTGLLTAKATTTGQGVFVVAELQTSGNVRRTDTALVKVTAVNPPPVLATLSIDPPDSAIRPMYTRSLGEIFLRTVGIVPASKVVALLRDTANASIPTTGATGVLIRYASLDPDTATIDRSGTVTFLQPGHVRFVATATVYGVTKTDTVTFTVTLPIAQDFAIDVSAPTPFIQTDFQIMPQGYVFWFWQNPNGAPVTMDLIFDNPPGEVAAPPSAVCDYLANFFDPGEYCGPGNISFPLPTTPESEFSTVRVRQFPVAGVYPYHTSTGVTGRIIVSAD